MGVESLPKERFLVWASDGVNTALDSSNANFTVVSKPPRIISIAPTSGQTYVISQKVAFEGHAFDPEDGLLPDEKLEWGSNTKIDDPDPVVPGGILTYTVVVTNGSDSRADDVVVVDGTQGLEAASIVASQVIVDGTVGSNGGCTVAVGGGALKVKMAVA